MWKLKKPNIQDDINDIDEAFPKSINRKGCDTCKLTDKEKNSLKDLYHKYDLYKGRLPLNLTNNMCSHKAEAIESMYSYTYHNKKLSYIREHLFRNIVYCPICSICAPTQLDHFLPKSQYPVLAINRQNLVPTCSYCNNKKNAKDNSNFIHAYYDEFPSQIFFIIKTSVADNQLSFEYTLDDSAFVGYEETKIRIETQWRDLELTKEWDKAINVFLLSFFSESICNGTEEGLKMFLNDRCNEYSRNFGKNDWRTALLRSLKENPAFTTNAVKNILRGISATSRENEILV